MELLSFDEFINEGYLLSLAKVYSKDWNKSRYKDLFLLYPHDKNAYRIFLDFKTPITKTIVPKPIENAIKSFSENTYKNTLVFIINTSSEHFTYM